MPDIGVATARVIGPLDTLPWDLEPVVCQLVRLFMRAPLVRVAERKFWLRRRAKHEVLDFLDEWSLKEGLKIVAKKEVLKF